jgi:hypothetical protein
MTALVDTGGGAPVGTMTFSDCGVSAQAPVQPLETQNYVPSSDNISAWTPDKGGAISVVSAASPMGGGQVTEYTGADRVSLPVPNLPAGTYTYSVWLRVTSGTAQIRIGAYPGSTEGTTYHQTSTVTTSWARYSLTFPEPSSNTAHLYVGQVLTNHVDVWGAQLEPSSTPGPYVSTSSSKSIPVTGFGGVAIWDSPPLTAGAHAFTASYSTGDYQASTSAPVWLMVNPPNSLALSASPATSSTSQLSCGSRLTLSATGPPNGSYVKFWSGSSLLGTSEVSAGTASLTTSALNSGLISIVASLADLSAVSAPITETVALKSLTVSASPLSPSYGSPVTLTVTGAQSGDTINFSSGGNSLGSATANSSGGAQVTTSSLKAGTSSITATDNALPCASGTLTVWVSANAFAFSVSPASSSLSCGSALTLSVSGAPSGSLITFSSGYGGYSLLGTATANSSGVASLTTSAFSSGSNLLEAETADSSEAATLSQNVSAMNLTVSASPSNPSYGSSVTLTATGALAGDTINFSSGNILLGTATANSSGTATVTTSALKGGTNSIVATDNALPCASGTLSLAVNPINSSVTLSSSANPSAVGAPLTLTATVTPANVTGSVTFFDGTGSLGIGYISNGMATLTTTGIGPAGSHSITAQYSGDANYKGAASQQLAQDINAHAGCAPGRAYSLAINIPGTRVKSDLIDFPFLFSGTYSYLADTAHNGNVHSSSGYDIVFTSDQEGQDVLDHEIDYYDGTGKVSFWIRIPVVSSSSTGTTIYMWYGDPAITSSQENIPGVWQNSYVSVYHLGNGTNLSMWDSATGSHGLSVAGSVSAVTGAIGEGVSFAGNSGDYLFRDVVDGFPSGAAPLTLEAWVGNIASGTSGELVGYGDNSAAGSRAGLYWDGSNFWMEFDSMGVDVPFTVDSKWHQLAGTYQGGAVSASSTVLYVDGSSPSATVSSGTPNITTTQLKIGGIPNYAGGGAPSASVDEVRISSVARSAAWIQAEYSNWYSPSTFYSVAASATAVPITWGYSTYRTITVNSGQVSGTLSNFPVLVSGVNADWANTAYGGKVQNPSGYDIVFTSDAAGQVQLDHEIDSYDPGTGTAAFWVKIPSLSSGTVFYMWYGNPAVATSQEKKTGVWSNQYSGVWHMGSGANLSAADSTGVNNGEVYGTLSAELGEIGTSAYNPGTGSYLVIGDNSSLDFNAGDQITASAWINLNNANLCCSDDIFADSAGSGLQNSRMGFDVAEHLRFYYRNAANTAWDSYSSSKTFTDYGNWHYVAFTYTYGNASTAQFYADGKQISGSWLTGTGYGNGSDAPHDGGGTLTIGGDGMDQWDWFYGFFDEVRISKGIMRSYSWIAAEWANQVSPCANQPSTTAFCSIGSPATPSIGGSAPVVTNVTPDFGVSGTAVTISGGNFGTVASAISVTFNNKAGTVTSASGDQIMAVVPAGASTGPLVVTVSNTAASPVNFTIVPAVTSVSPGYGTAGTSVTIQGSGFGSSQGDSSVTFNGLPATVTAWGSAGITVTVPPNATTGPLNITVGGYTITALIFRVSASASCIIAGLRPPIDDFSAQRAQRTQRNSKEGFGFLTEDDKGNKQRAQYDKPPAFLNGCCGSSSVFSVTSMVKKEWNS